MTETDADSESEIKLTTDEIDGNESEIIPNITVMVDVSSNNTEIENVVDLSNQQYTLANPMYTLGGLHMIYRRIRTLNLNLGGVRLVSCRRVMLALIILRMVLLPVLDYQIEKRTDAGIIIIPQIHVLTGISLFLKGKECDLTMIRVVKD